MKECCEITNPLNRDGTSQPQRFPLALAEDYVQIDERTPADLLNFTRRMAEEFNYYNGANSIDGTWAEFYQDDYSFLLAKISEIQRERYRTAFYLLLDEARDELELVAGQATLGTMVLFPAILIVLFTILYFWVKNRDQGEAETATV